MPGGAFSELWYVALVEAITAVATPLRSLPVVRSSKEIYPTSSDVGSSSEAPDVPASRGRIVRNLVRA